MERIRASAGWRAAGARRSGLVCWLRLALPLVASLSLLLASCSEPQGSGPTLARDQVFVWPLQAESKVSDEVFDPAEISSAYDSSSAQLIFSGLVTLDSNLNVVPDSATWTVDSSGTAYTFHLRPGLRFSDGTPIRAADFAYTIDRALDPHLCDVVDSATGAVITAYGNSPYGANCFYAGQTYLNHIKGAAARIAGKGGTDQSVVARGIDTNKGINIIDDQTLVIRLDVAIGFFLEALTYPSSYPVEQSLVNKYKNGEWVYHLDSGGCSGPFEIKSYNGGKQGTHVTYVPNPYWEQVHHKTLTLTEIDRPYISDAGTEYTNYRGGKYDYTDVPAQYYQFARGQADFNEGPALFIQYFGLNFLLPPFDNIYVRRAFDLALNKQFMVDRICRGGCIPTNHIVPQGMPGYYPGLLNPPPDRSQSLTGNQTAAQQLLAQARQGCTGKPGDHDWCQYIDNVHYSTLKEIDIYAGSNNPTRVAISQAAVATWTQAFQSSGLNIQAKPVDFNTLLANVYPANGPGNYQAWAIGWSADYPDPQDWLSLQFGPTAGYINASNVHDAGLNDLLNKADLALIATPQEAQVRMGYYHQAEQEVVDLVPWIPYAQEKVLWRLRFWVHGFGRNEQGTMPDLDWPNVYILAH